MKKTPARRKSAPRKSAAPKSTAKTPSKSASKSTSRSQTIVMAALEDMKATNVKVIDVRNLTSITDTMIVASGTSDRHVKSIASKVIEKAKAAGLRPYGVEGEKDGEWVLVDMPDVLVHVMLPRVREFYGLEKLWEVA